MLRGVNCNLAEKGGNHRKSEERETSWAYPVDPPAELHESTYKHAEMHLSVSPQPFNQ